MEQDFLDKIKYLRNQYGAKIAISSFLHNSEAYNHAETLLATYRVAMSDALQELFESGLFTETDICDYLICQLNSENQITKHRITETLPLSSAVKSFTEYLFKKESEHNG